MMPYIAGIDPETNEIIVGDSRRNVFFLRGPMMEEKAILDLLQAANERVHQTTSSMASDIAAQIEAGGVGRQD